MKTFYPLFKDPELSLKQFEITNAIHLIQLVFMWRAMIRLNEGKFWVKYDLPYEEFATLNQIPENKKYQKIINALLQIHTGVKKLKPYHTSHLDDVTRGINQLFEIIK